MAERRMFAKSIVQSDEFLDMPAEAKALYFMLCMTADDDGFCGSPRAVMRQCQVSDDAMKVLRAKKFVICFPKNGDESSYILVIKHWRIHNYIRRDTYNETKYKELMSSLYIDENKAYSQTVEGHLPALEAPVNVPSTARQRSVDDPSTQDRLGKDSVGKDSTETDKDSTDNNKKIIYIYTAKKFGELSPGLQAKAKHYLDLLDFSVNKCGHTNEEAGIIGMAAKEGIEIERAGG